MGRVCCVEQSKGVFCTSSDINGFSTEFQRIFKGFSTDFQRNISHIKPIGGGIFKMKCLALLSVLVLTVSVVQSTVWDDLVEFIESLDDPGDHKSDHNIHMGKGNFIRIQSLDDLTEEETATEKEEERPVPTEEEIAEQKEAAIKS